MPRKKQPARKLAVIDYETDPFLYGRIPAPFVAGFYELGNYLQFWGDDCVTQLIDYLNSRTDRLIIYAHNGGKFDFFFMLKYLENPLKVISGRIAQCNLGIHELRDSYSIIPIALGVYKKDTIDYQIMELENREANKAEISAYLKSDCVYLFELVDKFRDRFGDKLTIGATAIADLQKFHPFESQNSGHDQYFRPYYFGGRVECFESGIIKGDWKIYDVNSMYPDVMKRFKHPTGAKWLRMSDAKLTPKGNIAGRDADMYFAHIQCEQNGAFATRVKNEGLDFNVPSGEFWVTSHELKAAIDTGRVSNIKCLNVLIPYKTISFGDFVDHHVAAKIVAKKQGDKVGELFAKFLLNSAYGKFGSNPENYFDYFIVADGGVEPDKPYRIYLQHESGVTVWRKPAAMHKYFDVATAASITGAARSVLLRGLSAGKRVVYCDTDSIICESLPLALSETVLGAWKLEASGNTIAIAGKKLYALRNGKTPVKSASKGAILTDTQIFGIARGDVYHWQNMAPTFSLGNGVRFVDRKIQSRIKAKIA